MRNVHIHIIHVAFPITCTHYTVRTFASDWMGDYIGLILDLVLFTVIIHCLSDKGLLSVLFAYTTTSKAVLFGGGPGSIE